MYRGGQASIEYLLVMGFSLLLIVPLIFLFYTQTASVQGEVADSQLYRGARAIAESAERVYYLGSPSYEHVRIEFPSGSDRLELTNVSVVMRTLDGAEILYPSTVPINPKNISLYEGVIRFRVQATITGVEVTIS